MKYVYFWLFATVLFLTFNGYQISASSKFYTSVNKKVYYIENEPKYSWFDAYRNCINLNMTLATLDTMEKATNITKLVKNTFKKEVRLWIGGAAVGEHSNGFIWIATGKKFSYAPWKGGKPDYWRKNEYCVEIGANKDMQWNDLKCTYKLGFICEYNQPFEKQQVLETQNRELNLEVQNLQGELKNETSRRLKLQVELQLEKEMHGNLTEKYEKQQQHQLVMEKQDRELNSKIQNLQGELKNETDSRKKLQDELLQENQNMQKLQQKYNQQQNLLQLAEEMHTNLTANFLKQQQQQELLMEKQVREFNLNIENLQADLETERQNRQKLQDDLIEEKKNTQKLQEKCYPQENPLQLEEEEIQGNLKQELFKQKQQQEVLTQDVQKLRQEFLLNTKMFSQQLTLLQVLQKQQELQQQLLQKLEPQRSENQELQEQDKNNNVGKYFNVMLTIPRH